MLDSRERYTPTPVISQAILDYNRGRAAGFADGIVITPSHNPPQFGGIRYDPPTGGPAATPVTQWIEERANAIIAAGSREVARIPFERARRAATNHPLDYRRAYVEALDSVVEFDLLRGSALAIGVDPLGGASVDYWESISDRILLGLLAAEITARPGRDPGERYQALTQQLGEPVYARIDAPATPEEKAALAQLTPAQLDMSTLAGDPITSVVTATPQAQPIGGIKVVTTRGWFAARP